jgi:hypothetical protein
MLANDSNEQKQQGGFSLLVNAHRGVAELMAGGWVRTECA